MGNEFFPVTGDFLRAIQRLNVKDDPDFKVIRDHIAFVSSDVDAMNIHRMPDFRMNYSERFHTLCGIGIALDVLKNIFINPVELLVELSEQEEVEKIIDKAKETESEAF
jgi:hypothetical protein